jgi:hypothetical protein
MTMWITLILSDARRARDLESLLFAQQDDRDSVLARPNNRLQGMRGHPCFRRTTGLRGGPAPLILEALGRTLTSAHKWTGSLSWLRW